MYKLSATRRHALTTLASLTLLAAAAQTTPARAADTATKPSLVIGSMIWNTSVPFYANFIKGQQETAARLGVKLNLVDGKGDLGTEVAAIRQLIAQRVDAILVTASDAKGIVPAIKQANAAGIPVFAVNNRVGEGAQVVTFVGADDVEFGRQQGKLLIEEVGPSAKVAYLMGGLGSSAQLLRKQGFDEYLKAYPQVKVLVSQTSNWDAAKALTVTQDWLNKYSKGSIDAVVGQGPEGANAAKYASNSGRTDVKFVLGDYPLEVRSGIQAGHVLGTVNQDPRPQGERSVQAAVQWLTGAKSQVKQPNEFLPLPIVTKSNVASFAPAWGQ